MISVEEVGRIFRYATGINMASSTALTLKFKRPDTTTFTRTNPSVTAPPVPVTDDDLGGLNASEYMAYTTVPGDFDVDGTWSVCGVYEDSKPSRFVGKKAIFTVNEGCD